MKKIKLLTLGLMIAGTTLLSSCKKEDMSEYAKKEDVKNTVIENVDLTIQSYQWTWNSFYKSWEYSHPHSYIYDGVLVGYVMNGQGKQALPFYNANTGVTYGLVDATFDNKILVTYYDGTTSLAKPTNETYVYLKIIPSSQMKPNVDYTDFEAVAEAHDF